MVGGVAYHAGKKVQEGREEDAYRDQQIEDLQQQQQYQQQPPAYAPPPPAPNQGISPDAMEQLKQLADLKAQGILTDEEFASQKAKILGL
jgi:hypothetical protein